MRTHLYTLASRSLSVRAGIVLGLGGLAAAAALAQATLGAPVPGLIAHNDCSGSECARQMLSIKQFDTWQQQVIAGTVQRMPWSLTTGSNSKRGTSCSWHEHGPNQWTLVCLTITSEGTCSCVLTSTGGACIGTHPGCPARI